MVVGNDTYLVVSELATRPSMTKVPTSQFDYRKFLPADRLPAFRQLTASLYETWSLGEPESFQAEAYGHQVKDLIFTEVEFGATRFKRSSAHTQGGGQDFLTLHAQLAGIEHLVMDHGIVQLLPGRIYLRDWAYPFECKSTPMYMHTIVIPRHRLASSVVLDKDNPILDWQISKPDGGMLFKRHLGQPNHDGRLVRHGEAETDETASPAGGFRCHRERVAGWHVVRSLRLYARDRGARFGLPGAGVQNSRYHFH